MASTRRKIWTHRYASKSLPAPAQNYSVTELEMTGMAVNIHLWRHLLHRLESDCVVNHRAIPYIVKAKTLPATTRIMRLLEVLSGYAFNLYFVKGKDMKNCDLLSRIDVDRGNPEKSCPYLLQLLLYVEHNEKSNSASS